MPLRLARADSPSSKFRRVWMVKEEGVWSELIQKHADETFTKKNCIDLR